MRIKSIFIIVLISGYFVLFGNSAKIYHFNQIEIQPDTFKYQIDTKKSYVQWFMDAHYGIVLLNDGQLTVTNNQLVEGNFIISMDSIINQDIDYELMRETLLNTLRSDVFFNTERFPYSIFTIDQVLESKKPEYQITGDLNLLGNSQCIDFNAQISLIDNILKAESDTIRINRTYWGITAMSESYANSDKSFIVSDEIKIVVILHAVKVDK